ncbi:hypothetical protein MHB85_19035 [Paenibacillus sp. FSL K6-4396]|uniref:hypothetical protein n=1 Tax=Paenibacillus sp. FSL K6-4396 TaxID=2921506 RepID=UPI0030F8BA43
MNTVIYISLGFFDALAMLLIILKLYMLPVREYAGKIFVFVIFIASFSYMMRITLGMPKLDLPFQYIFFILFLRLGMELKPHISSFIAGAGISAYAAIQMGIFHIFEWLDVMHIGVVQQNEGSLVYLLQSSSILIAYLICFVFSIFDFGFSFIIRPPHDFIKKENYLSKTNIPFLIGTTISAITICMTLVLLYRSDPTGLLFLAISTFGVSYFFSVRRERGDIRTAVEAYRNKHKNG